MDDKFLSGIGRAGLIALIKGLDQARERAVNALQTKSEDLNELRAEHARVLGWSSFVCRNIVNEGRNASTACAGAKAALDCWCDTCMAFRAETKADADALGMTMQEWQIKLFLSRARQKRRVSPLERTRRRS